MKTKEFEVSSATILLLLAYRLKETKLTFTEDRTTATVMDYHHARSQINVNHDLAAGTGISSGFNKNGENGWMRWRERCSIVLWMKMSSENVSHCVHKRTNRPLSIFSLALFIEPDSCYALTNHCDKCRSQSCLYCWSGRIVGHNILWRITELRKVQIEKWLSLLPTEIKRLCSSKLYPEPLIIWQPASENSRRLLSQKSITCCYSDN